MDDLRRRLDDWAGRLDVDRNGMSHRVGSGYGHRNGNRNLNRNGVGNWNVDVVCYWDWYFVGNSDTVGTVNRNGNWFVNGNGVRPGNVNGVRFGDRDCDGVRNRNVDVFCYLDLVRLRHLLSVFAGDVGVTMLGDLYWG